MKMSWADVWKALITVVMCSKWTIGFVIKIGDCSRKQKQRLGFQLSGKILSSTRPGLNIEYWKI